MRYGMDNFIFVTSKYSICNVSVMENPFFINIIIMCYTFKHIS